ncbi:MAG: cupredoxin domain-containing protein [Chloroflexota bacterium]|nr:cupredoxin domain-containing protein [Chloroflexota bacterium]
MNHNHTFSRRQISLALTAAALTPAIALLGPRLIEAQESSPEASPAASPSASPVAGNEVEIGAYDIYFDPKEVTIKADTEITIKVPNHGVTLHTFVINDHKNEDLPFDEIHLSIDPGKTEEVKLKAPAGKYYFWCDIPGHEAAGMWGYITAK